MEGKASVLAPHSNERPWTLYYDLTLPDGRFGFRGHSAIITGDFYPEDLQNPQGYLEAERFQQLSQSELPDGFEFDVEAIYGHPQQLPLDCHVGGFQTLDNEKYFFLDVLSTVTDEVAISMLPTVIDFDPAIDLVCLRILPPYRQVTVTARNQPVAAVTLPYDYSPEERKVELLFRFDGGRCKDIERHDGSSICASDVKIATSVPVIFYAP